MTARACFIVCWLVLVANVSLGDEIELNNGNVIEGTIVEETDKYVVIKTDCGKMTLSRSQIASIKRWKLPETKKKTAPIPLDRAQSLSGEVHRRKLSAIRRWNIPVFRGQKIIASVPLLMSFWGATNEQVVESSEITFSEEPDHREITSDNLGMWRRNLVLTWLSPKSDRILVTQKLKISLTCRNKLYTMAELPYSAGIRRAFRTSLMTDLKEGINPNNPAIAPICSKILSQSAYAEKVVEGVCDWINQNIPFRRGVSSTSDEALSKRGGSCGQLSMVACAMLRYMGIPAEMVSGKFIGGKSGHTYIEVYYPDAGWVFYDPTNRERGFKSLDCLMTAGHAFRVRPPPQGRWTKGYFIEETDMQSFSRLHDLERNPFRNRPEPFYLGVKTVRLKPPLELKVRHYSLREIIMDTSMFPAGKRKYKPLKNR